MIHPLSNFRILVADDQGDVAQTLCRPLNKAGARLRYVADGHTALQELATHPFDLVLIDMKMLPKEWGGLWLLQQIKDAGWHIPSLVLSGEGSKQQVIEALRLGATDWIDKDRAEEELLERCAKLAESHLSKSVDLASIHLPTPLAYRLARYSRATDSDKRVLEGLHALESIFRFTAVLGLSSTPPTPLRGITPERVVAPSMGTWFDTCTGLMGTPGAGIDFTRLFTWLAPERADRQAVQSLITVRNDFAHGRGEPTLVHAEQLDALLIRFAHRAFCFWRSDLTVPVSMTYDGSMYTVNVLNYKGVGSPIPATIHTTSPVITGQFFLMPRDATPFSLAPWIVAQAGQESDKLRCLQFDGLQRTKGGLTPDTPFKYAKADEGNDTPLATQSRGTWRILAPWTS